MTSQKMNQRELALSYAAAKIPVFPCRHADEESHSQETGEIITLKAKTPLVSSGFKGATLSPRIINIHWDRHPNAMVGIPTGEQLGAWVLDVDVHKDDNGEVINGFETLAALEDLHGPLPRTAVARTAGGGEHHYFAYAPGVRNRGRLGAGLDIRGSGGYCIAPGSVTGDGAEYVWLDHDGDGLPPLVDAPAWLLELVLPKAAPVTHSDYTYTPGENTSYVERAVEGELRALSMHPQGGRGEAVNRSAFSLGTLVGAGALSRQEAEAGLYEAAFSNGVVAKDGEKEIRAKIKRGLDAGIKQPRAIPASSHAEAPSGDAAGFLEGVDARKAKRLSEKGIQKVVSNRAEVRPQPVSATVETIPQAETPEEEDIPEYKLEAVADLETLTYPGGLVQDLVDWIVSSSEHPCRALAMAAVLPLVGALCGPRYSTGSRDTRPNLYTVALAESGFGKDHARSQIKRLLMSDQGVFADYSGPARIMSASALREVLEKNQSVNCQIDEFGGFVRDITDRKAGGHQRAISTDLRDYYSASSTFFEGAAYRGTPPKRVYNPNLCVHGTSTPEQFWTALSSASAEDGLLPRLILFHITGDKPPQTKPEQDVRYVPGWLLERMSRVAGIDVVKKRMGKSKEIPLAPGTYEVKPYIVPWTADALGIFRSVKETIDANEGRAVAEARPFMRRIVENAIKLALIAAVGVDPEKPVITEAIFEWAAGVAWTCAAGMLAEVTERLADNQREANYKRIASIIKAAGKRGMTDGKLADRCKAIDTRQREELINDLKLAGKVTAGNDNKRGPKAQRYVWVG